MTTPMFDGPVMVELLDGQLVFSDAEEWRHECECRAILTMPLAARRDHLFDLERMRGVDEVARIKVTLQALHEARGQGA